MAKKTVLVTGGTDGIGFQTALELARGGHKVLIHGRDKTKGIHAVDQITRESCQEALTLYLADFASLESVVRMANDLNREQDRLDVLINNAGTFSKNRQLTVDGFELTFQVNVLAPFLLTNLLLGLLKESAPARIVNVASAAHHSISEVNLDNLQGEHSYDAQGAYALSKLADILFTNELARRLEGSGVTANSLHPGVIDTKLLKMSYGGGGRSIEDGARTPVYLATSEAVESVSGRYFSSMAEKTPSPLAQDEHIQRKMWNALTEMAGAYMDDTH